MKFPLPLVRTAVDLSFVCVWEPWLFYHDFWVDCSIYCFDRRWNFLCLCPIVRTLDDLFFGMWLPRQSLWFLSWLFPRFIFLTAGKPSFVCVLLSGLSLWFLSWLFRRFIFLTAGKPLFVSYCLDCPVWFLSWLFARFILLTAGELSFVCVLLSRLSLWFLSWLFVVCVGGLLTSINTGLAIPVGFATCGPVLRQLPHHHHHPVATEQWGGACLQRLRPLLQASWGKTTFASFFFFF